MLDQVLRARLRPRLDRVAGSVAARGVPPIALTGIGLLAGLGACVCVGTSAYGAALGLWLLNRLLDGLDGAVARRRQATDLGGVLDFVADFVVYGGFIVGVAIASPGARVACLVLLAAYLVNIVALLSFASVIERRALPLGDERSLKLLPGLAEGAETIVVYVLFCLLPGSSTTIAWVFAALVAATAVQRVAEAVRTLGAEAAQQKRDAKRVAGRRGRVVR
jgi:phosphatidylglycerophosphate synthase